MLLKIYEYGRITHNKIKKRIEEMGALIEWTKRLKMKD